jgi:hypothetical protein
LKPRPNQVSLQVPWTGAKISTLRSGKESNQHGSTPTFRLVSENACFETQTCHPNNPK